MDIVQPGGGGGGTPLSVTDGVTTVSSVSILDFVSGAVISNGGAGQANIAISGTGGGTVTSVSVVSANGLAGTVATATTTPAITLSTTVTGILKGNGTTISAATPGTDYVTATSTNTLTNKTTTGLKADGFQDTNGNKVVEIDAITASTGANFLIEKAAATGQAVVLQASGSDTDVYLNLVTQGAGTVRANGVDVVTLSGTQTLTNKTLTSPVLTTPTLGVASATTINKVTITAPATGSTLTIADGKTLTVSNTLTFTGTDSSSVAFGAGGTVLYGNQTITLSGDVTGSGTTAITTTVAKIAGTVVSGTTGTTNVVFSASPALTGSPTAPTQTAGDNTTKIATDAFVTTAISNAIAGVNPAVAVQAATIQASDTSSLTYNNGVSGVGATFTGANNTALTIDGFTFTAIGQRLLVKNDTQSPSGAFNGIYNVTQIQTAILPPILTRALDYDTPSDINNTGAIPVVNGTVNALTSWLLTSTVNTVGTDPLTYTQFSVNPTLTPQVTYLTSGTGTYTTPAGTLYLVVEVKGPGSGGAGSGTTPGTVTAPTTASSFGTSLLTANVGGAPSTTTPGTGGTGTGGDINIPGQAGGAGAGGYTFQAGGSGGGVGGGFSTASTNGANAVTNSGGGGGGGGADSAAAPGAGGGEGGYVKKTISTPSTSYAYVVGAGSAGGTLGTSGRAGGNGAAGFITVTAYFH